MQRFIVTYPADMISCALLPSYLWPIEGGGIVAHYRAMSPSARIIV